MNVNTGDVDRETCLVAIKKKTFRQIDQSLVLLAATDSLTCIVTSRPGIDIGL